jgi:hypothetical protein
MATSPRFNTALSLVLLGSTLGLASPTLRASGGDGGYGEENNYAPQYHVAAPALAGYASGKLGVVPGSYWRVYLLLAYEALTGHPFSAQELAALEIDGWHIGAAGGIGWDYSYEDAKNGVGDWKLARRTSADAPDLAYGLNPYRYGNHNSSFINCGKDAFLRAAATLADRQQRGDAKAAALWLAAQDAVFANCSPVHNNGAEAPTVLPQPPPKDAPEWLHKDYAYQHAAALFYAEEYDAAHAEFLVLAEDKASPWQPLGRYLAVTWPPAACCARARHWRSLNTAGQCLRIMCSSAKPA